MARPAARGRGLQTGRAVAELAVRSAVRARAVAVVRAETGRTLLLRGRQLTGVMGVTGRGRGGHGRGEAQAGLGLQKREGNSFSKLVSNSKILSKCCLEWHFRILYEEIRHLGA